MASSLPTAPSRPARAGRDRYWDAVRGVCILAVIWIHTRNGIAYDGGAHDWAFDYWLVVRQAMNFAVAVFIFLAAYFVTPTKVGPGWLRTRAARLGIPFLLWSVGYTLLIAWVESASNDSGGEADASAWNLRLLLRDVVLGSSVAHLYFIVVLLQLVVLTPLVLRLLETRWRWALWLITPAYLASVYARALTEGAAPSFANTWFAGWFAFYLAGLWVRRHGAPRLGVGGAVAAVAVTFAASVGEAYLLLQLGVEPGFAADQLTVSSVAYSFAVIALLLAIHRRREQRAGERWLGLDRLGRDSYGIYYVHMVWIVLAWQVIGLPIADGEFPFLPGLQIAELAVVVALSLLTIAAVRRLLGARAASRLLGF
ncbi:acyltransferase [Serinibacter salmoneus]|uniref:Surface polysaccharide O-acyltransferase-like enzyme n=1 Tax=Serinibacter salmoneus TaxID=556530 RepID=A0A2A9D131_9MICO|nr:acyltransferase [Serinibacter salmoneus]PFG20086.1 surface polysaccharide O-acyltransferase-like enzyme [Serinibacter salmoneus]